MYINPNKYHVDNDTVNLTVLHKGIEHVVNFDACKIDIVNQFHWRLSQKKKLMYPCTGQVKNGGKIIYMHNLVMGYTPVKGYEVDHIDGNPLNNTVANLRLVSRAENIRNSSVRSDNKSTGIRGVSVNAKYGTYVVDFYHNGRRVYMKHFKQLRDAAFARLLLEFILSDTFRSIKNDTRIYEVIKDMPEIDMTIVEGYVISLLDKYAEKHGGEVLTNTKHWHQVRRGEADYQSRLFY